MGFVNKFILKFNVYNPDGFVHSTNLNKKNRDLVVAAHKHRQNPSTGVLTSSNWPG